MTLILRHEEIFAPGDMVHFTRAELTTMRPEPLHAHNFYELFWVQNGIVRHHLADDVVQMMEGEIALIPPGRSHGVQGKGEFCLIVSISIHPDVIDAMRHRHDAALNDLLEIQTSTRGSKDLAQLNQTALKLERSDRSALAAEAFLLPVLIGFTETPPNSALPQWLIDAMAQAQDPKVFKHGSAGFVAITGKAHAHVSRTMRAKLGCSPSDYINEIRMTYAARQLVTDSDSVQSIANDCGLPNMAHFHKLFRAQFGLTPLKYRQKFQRDVVQPKG